MIQQVPIFGEALPIVGFQLIQVILPTDLRLGHLCEGGPKRQPWNPAIRRGCDGRGSNTKSFLDRKVDKSTL